MSFSCLWKCPAERLAHFILFFSEEPWFAIASLNYFETFLCFAGRLLPCVQRSWNLSRKYHQFNRDIKFQSYSKRKKSNFIAECSSNGMGNDLNLDLSNKLIHNASVIYCVSAAMGHNKVILQDS